MGIMKRSGVMAGLATLVMGGFGCGAALPGTGPGASPPILATAADGLHIAQIPPQCGGGYVNPAYGRFQIAEENAVAFRVVGQSTWLPKCVSAPDIVEENATSFRRVGSSIWQRK